MSEQISEFDFIEGIREKFFRLVPRGVEGIGDDCAIIQKGGNMATVITTDMLGEDVHFRSDVDPFALAVRSVQVNISDVAAMGATPLYLLLSVAFPSRLTNEWKERFMEGIYSCKVPLIGGDTTKSADKLSISIVAIGEVDLRNIKRRSGALVGDKVMVSGELGLSASTGYTSEVFAQVAEGKWLGERIEVNSMMDISDGVAGDICHILKESDVGCTIELTKVPIAKGATLENALSGGEDYKMLITVRKENAEQLRHDYRARFGKELYEIGEITDSGELKFTDHGVETEKNFTGFTHF